MPVLALQVLFLLYHYFEAREVYNAIRVFIAGYVWMTGYNNFSYYYRSKDFNISRYGSTSSHKAVATCCHLQASCAEALQLLPPTAGKCGGKQAEHRASLQVRKTRVPYANAGFRMQACWTDSSSAPTGSVR